MRFFVVNWVYGQNEGLPVYLLLRYSGSFFISEKFFDELSFDES